MAGANNFGTPATARELDYEANFKGPLHLLSKAGPQVDLVATHQDQLATLGLTMSAQKLTVDTSKVPNTVSGTASFFSKDGKDALFCTFHGTLSPLDPASGRQEAYVQTVFTGGEGQFQGATGTGSVEAELYPSLATSQGTIKAKVILP